MDNRELSSYIKKESRKVIDSSTTYGTILPFPMKIQSGNILQEHARTWVLSSLLSQGLKSVSFESNAFTVFLNDLSLAPVSGMDRERNNERNRESSKIEGSDDKSRNMNMNMNMATKDDDLITPADLLVKWLETSDSTHPNFKVRHLLIHCLLFICLSLNFFIYFFICLSIYLFIYLFIYIFIYL